MVPRLMDLTTLLILTISTLGIALLATLNTIRREPTTQLKNIENVLNEDNAIKKGYAYTVDIGDSLLIVAVIDKNSSNEIMTVNEKLLEVKSIADKN
jgi:hypothetical protein